MKVILIFSVLIIGALAAPLDSSKDAEIISYENDVGINRYSFG